MKYDYEILGARMIGTPEERHVDCPVDRVDANFWRVYRHEYGTGTREGTPVRTWVADFLSEEEAVEFVYSVRVKEAACTTN